MRRASRPPDRCTKAAGLCVIVEVTTIPLMQECVTMFGKRLFIWLAMAAAFVLPLIFADVADADSGCHRSGGGTSQTQGPKR